MTYVALLRAINVGGKGIMKMAALRACFEDAGLTRVATYIQSGNIVFDSKLGAPAVTRTVAAALSAAFGYDSAVVVRSHTQFRRVVADAPRSWPRGDHLRRYIAFLRAPVTPTDALEHVAIKEGIDAVAAGNGVLYLSTLLSGLSKTRFTKLATRPIYKDMTIRSYATCLKILKLIGER
jgi:uncharacterized protein (DUF1697 family)